ncbi:MAG: chemotaxis response regulator protein-glutamate methylesterase [Fusobacteria bacterium]|jgi:two-component system chemotaxis response regulator CheB|nr:chemotaxis response regulator protein-glutamate methylesterase [Fusobacteriota bacterium]
MINNSLNKIKVLIIDDSAMVRKVFTQVLSNESDIEVVGTAPDPVIGRDKIVFLKPDVIILDIEMPKMDGLTFLKKLMKHYPMPVIIVSSIAADKSKAALDAFEYGAMEVLKKPGSSFSVKDMGEQLVEKVRAVYRSKKINRNGVRTSRQIENREIISNKIVVIGASTGGTEALKKLLMDLPENIPPILIVQHMPESFTAAFAERLNSLCKFEVREAKHNDEVRKNLVLIAPGNYHMVLKKKLRYYVEIKDGPLIHHQRPAVDVLFKSAAMCAGKDSVAVILTGMGKDGAEGLLELKNSGAYTITQDEASSVVYGMPKEAYLIGASMDVQPLDHIAEEIMKKV